MGNSGGNTGWELLQPASVPVDQFTILFPALECVCVRPDHETAGMPLKKCAPSRIKFAPWCYIVYAQREPNPQVGITVEHLLDNIRRFMPPGVSP